MCYLAASRRWIKDYALGNENIAGQSHYEIFPEIPEEWRAAHRRGLAGEVVRCDEDRFDRPQGYTQWLRWELRPWYVDDGSIGGIVIFAEDITEAKKTENARRESEERFRQVAENAGEWIWEVDANGMFTFCSPAVEAILGYSPEELIGTKHFFDLFSPDVQSARMVRTDRKLSGLCEPQCSKRRHRRYSRGQRYALLRLKRPTPRFSRSCTGYHGKKAYAGGSLASGQDTGTDCRCHRHHRPGWCRGVRQSSF
jgi:PAS domain S-box-containing protein